MIGGSAGVGRAGGGVGFGFGVGGVGGGSGFLEPEASIFLPDPCGAASSARRQFPFVLHVQAPHFVSNWQVAQHASLLLVNEPA